MDLKNLPQYRTKDPSTNIEDYLKDNPEMLRNTLTLGSFLNENDMDREAGLLVGEQDFIEEFTKNNEISEYEMKNLMDGKIQFWRL